MPGNDDLALDAPPTPANKKMRELYLGNLQVVTSGGAPRGAIGSLQVVTSGGAPRGVIGSLQVVTNGGAPRGDGNGETASGCLVLLPDPYICRVGRAHMLTRHLHCAAAVWLL